MWLTILGGAAGAIGAFALGRTMSSLLYGVTAADAAAFGVALSLSSSRRSSPAGCRRAEPGP